MLIDIDLIPELLSECGIMENGEPRLVITQLGRFS